MGDRVHLTTARLQAIAAHQVPRGAGSFIEFQRSCVTRIMRGESIRKVSASFRPPVSEDLVTACLVAHMNDELEHAERRASTYARLAMGGAKA